MVHIRFLFNSRINKGYSLFSKLTDYYFTKEIKIVSTILGKLALIVFYNVSFDFYFISPFILNLIDIIQHICETPAPSAQKLKKCYFHISTVISDTLNLFNGFTRTSSVNFKDYLGQDSIFNQVCFIPIKKNSPELSVFYRDYLTKNYEKQKNQKNKDPHPKRIYIQSSSFVFYVNKRKKGLRLKEYTGKPFDDTDGPPEICQDSKDKFNTVTVVKTDTNNNNKNLRYNFGLENLDKAAAQFLSSSTTTKSKSNTNIPTVKGGEIDLLGLGLYSEAAGDSQSVQYSNNYNTVKNNNKESFEINFDRDTVEKINQNVLKMNNQTKLNILDTLDDSKETQTRSQSTNNVSIYNNSNNFRNGVNFQDFNYFDFTSKSKFGLKKPTHTENYSVPQGGVGSCNQSLLSNKVPPSNSFSAQNPQAYPQGVPTFQKVQTFQNFSTLPGFGNNFMNERYETSLNKTKTLQQSFNSVGYSNQHSQSFAQDDMSFLIGSINRGGNKEDFIQLDKYNPQIFCELKERIYILFDQKGNASSIDSKGYIGLSLKKGFKIQKKKFSLMFLKDSWKGPLFQNKEIDQKLQKVTEMNYSIELGNQENQVKMITYTINNQALAANRVLKGSFSWNNNTISISLSYTNMINFQNIYKTSIVIYPRTGMKCFVVSPKGGLSSVGKNGETTLSYPKGITEEKIEMNGTNVIWKIGIRIELANAIVSGNDISVSFNNSIKIQENLKVSKLALVNYEYML